MSLLRKLLLPVAAIAMAAGVTAPAEAAVVTFDDRTAYPATGGTPAPNLIVDDEYASLGIIFGEPGESAGVVPVSIGIGSPPNSACGVGATGSILGVCASDIYFRFVLPDDAATAAVTDSLSFVVGDTGGDVDSWTFHLYGIDGTELEARDVASLDATLQTFNVAGIHRVWIEWTAPTLSGYLLDTVQFDTPTAPVTAVPEPAAVALLSMGLLGIGGLGIRRRRS